MSDDNLSPPSFEQTLGARLAMVFTASLAHE